MNSRLLPLHINNLNAEPESSPALLAPQTLSKTQLRSPKARPAAAKAQAEFAKAWGPDSPGNVPETAQGLSESSEFKEFCELRVLSFVCLFSILASVL